MTLDEAHFGALETRIPEIDFDNVPFVKAMDIFYDMWQHNRTSAGRNRKQPLYFTLSL
jgi:hypothetical protein